MCLDHISTDAVQGRTLLGSPSSQQRQRLLNTPQNQRCRVQLAPLDFVVRMGDHFTLDSKTVTPIECLHYSMKLPTSVVITGCDSMPILQQALQAVRSFQLVSVD
jgi:hypothetical protein